MGLLATSLANAMKSLPTPYDQSTIITAQDKISKCLQDFYNRQIFNIAYAGTIPGPPPVPDPVVSDVWKLSNTSSLKITWSSSSESDSTSSFESFKLSIQTSVLTLATSGNIITPASGTILMFPGFSLKYTQQQLKSIVESEQDDPCQACWDIIASDIINNTQLNYLKSTAAINPASGSTGMATITFSVID